MFAVSAVRSVLVLFLGVSAVRGMFMLCLGMSAVGGVFMLCLGMPAVGGVLMLRLGVSAVRTVVMVVVFCFNFASMKLCSAALNARVNVFLMSDGDDTCLFKHDDHQC